MTYLKLWKALIALASKFLHRWNECANYHLEAGKRAYYAFENTCNHGEVMCQVLKKYLSDTFMTLVLLYWVKVWGNSIPKSTWKEFENVQKISYKISPSL